MSTTKLSRQVKRTTYKLLNWINENNIGVHEKIPNMAKLSKEFGVSINTVHSAVRYLRDEGILDTGVGSGTFLVRPIDEIAEIAEVEDGDKVENDKRYTVGLIVSQFLAEFLDSNSALLNEGDWGHRILLGIYQAAGALNINIKPIGIELKNWFNPTVENFVSAITPQLKGIDGLISFPVRGHIIVAILEKLGLPWVLINPPDDLSTTNYVSPDYYGSSVAVGQLAARLGSEHIWMLTHLPSWPSNRQRIRGIRDGIMFEHGKFEGITIVTTRDTLYEDGIIAMSDALEKHEHIPDFIYTAGDFLAEAAVDVIKTGGLIPGKDVSIISSTGLPEIAEYNPPISTVELPMIETGESIIEMIYRMFKTNQHTLPAKIIPTPIVLRETTPPEAKDILEEIEQEHTKQHDMEMMKMLL